MPTMVHGHKPYPHTLRLPTSTTQSKLTTRSDLQQLASVTGAIGHKSTNHLSLQQTTHRMPQQTEQSPFCDSYSCSAPRNVVITVNLNPLRLSNTKKLNADDNNARQTQAISQVSTCVKKPKLIRRNFNILCLLQHALRIPLHACNSYNLASCYHVRSATGTHSPEILIYKI